MLNDTDRLTKYYDGAKGLGANITALQKSTGGFELCCHECESHSEFCGGCHVNDVIHRLAEYESTSLTPSDIEQMKAELQRYKDDEVEGRCVVLPCKVGDTVYVRSDTWGNVWNYKTIANGKLLVGEVVSIIKTKKQTLMKIQAEHNVVWQRNRKRYTVGAIGNTVFLTRSAAEAALSEVQE